MMKKYTLKMTIVAMILLPCSSNAAARRATKRGGALSHVVGAHKYLEEIADEALDREYSKLFKIKEKSDQDRSMLLTMRKRRLKQIEGKDELENYIIDIVKNGTGHYTFLDQGAVKTGVRGLFEKNKELTKSLGESQARERILRAKYNKCVEETCAKTFVVSALAGCFILFAMGR
jgi:hypothetical protein